VAKIQRPVIDASIGAAAGADEPTEIWSPAQLVRVKTTRIPVVTLTAVIL
jgi:hypothetical protein